MLLADTNVLVRFITADDSRQHARATALIEESEIWISRTVLLETEWVLRSSYGYTQLRVVEALRAILGLPSVRVEDSLGVAKALAWTTRGLDFADALHLAACGPEDRFVTFDERLAKRARRVTPVEIVAL